MTTRVYTAVKAANLDVLVGYTEVPTTSPYEVVRLKKGNMLLILYTSGKLVVHGDESLPFVSHVGKMSVSDKGNDASDRTNGVFIGSDETLKGDTFGGLIVCAAYFEQEEVDVDDSKSMSDEQIKDKAKFLLQDYSERFSLQALLPAEYNRAITEYGTVTRLLDVLHVKVAEQLKLTYDAQHVVDRYPGCTVGDIREQGAEKKYTAVAAASIVARYFGLLQFEGLSEQAGFFLPMGSTHVAEALQELKKRNLSFTDFCKVHFRNVRRIQQG